LKKQQELNTWKVEIPSKDEYPPETITFNWDTQMWRKSMVYGVDGNFVPTPGGAPIIQRKGRLEGIILF
jgi:hypothetical protein